MANEVLDPAHFMTLAMNGQGVSQAITPCTTGTADTMHIIFWLHRQIVINRVTNSLHINTACSDIGGNQHTHTTILHFSQGARTLALIHITMQRHH
jgi:hypothetical protein